MALNRVATNFGFFGDQAFFFEAADEVGQVFNLSEDVIRDLERWRQGLLSCRRAGSPSYFATGSEPVPPFETSWKPCPAL